MNRLQSFFGGLDQGMGTISEMLQRHEARKLQEQERFQRLQMMLAQYGIGPQKDVYSEPIETTRMVADSSPRQTGTPMPFGADWTEQDAQIPQGTDARGLMAASDPNTNIPMLQNFREESYTIPSAPTGERRNMSPVEMITALAETVQRDKQRAAEAVQEDKLWNRRNTLFEQQDKLTDNKLNAQESERKGKEFEATQNYRQQALDDLNKYREGVLRKKTTYRMPERQRQAIFTARGDYRNASDEFNSARSKMNSDMRELDLTENKTAAALSALEDSSVKANTGPIMGRVNDFRALANLGNEKTLDTNALIEELVGQIRNSRFGGALTANEASLAARFLPEPYDSIQQKTVKLQRLLKTIQGAKTRLKSDVSKVETRYNDSKNKLESLYNQTDDSSSTPSTIDDIDRELLEIEAELSRGQ